MNPALIRGVAPKDVEVRVPAGKAADVLAALEAIPSENRKAWRLHRVAGGDTLASISKRYSAPASSIIKVNTRLGESFFDSPRDGELILIPAREVPVKASVKKSKSRRTVTRSKARTTVSARSAKKRPAAKKVASTSAKRR